VVVVKKVDLKEIEILEETVSPVAGCVCGFLCTGGMICGCGCEKTI
jgi:hypothetical protein